MFRTIALALLLSLTAVAHAQSDASPGKASQLPSLDDADPVMKAALEDKHQLTLQLAGFSHHFQTPKNKDGTPAKNFAWNEKNWSIGVQRERAMTGDWDGWVEKTSVGAMKDSLYVWGLYAGRTWQKRALNTQSFTADVGGGGFVFYRTLTYKGKRLLVPAVLPVVSAAHKETGIGFNMVFVPHFKSKSGEMPAVAYLQFTKEF